ncbi:PTS sugar transporter subunit IIA [Clostridium tarantellae]|uniref:PTS EIIA type-4 domain-containing protein n=1 Tax=Clostridium tarantellae TaxID=39493 RepID=A0A6I1MJA2_9CLOT|nr:hypothetical protein [Clostridium tarantellae]MPQ43465.1 hypothetical protein [Clostridium tarantellae]
MYNILIVGHGNFASGMKSAVDLLLGASDRVHCQNLSQDITHEKFEEIVGEYINKYDQLVVFADLLGGAPSQITTRKIVEANKSKEQFIVSGISLSVIIDIATNLLILNEEKNISEKINESLNNVRSTMAVMSLIDFEETEDEDNEGDMI